MIRDKLKKRGEGCCGNLGEDLILFGKSDLCLSKWLTGCSSLYFQQLGFNFDVVTLFLVYICLKSETLLLNSVNLSILEVF